MVRPAFVCNDMQLSNISDVFNGITVYGDGFDEVMFYGRGAGKLPTASAVVGDIIDCARLSGTSVSQTWEDSDNADFIEDYKNDSVAFYVRMTDADKVQIAGIFGDVEYLSREGQPADEAAFVTKEMPEKDFDANLEKLSGKVLGKIRILNIR